MALFLGLDFGTSGARACAINQDGAIVHEDRCAYAHPEEPAPLEWREALLSLLQHLPPQLAEQLNAICVDAASATTLLCDTALRPIFPVLAYYDNRAAAEAVELQKLAPPNHVVCTPTSGLAKFLWLARHGNLSEAAYFMHQADWLAALLTGTGGISDYHNALKTGYDTERMQWPEWALNLPHAHLLPKVIAPGAAIANISPEIAQHFEINTACRVRAGTTDSIAAFIAAGVSEPGTAVTSLGTTLVLKLLSEHRVEAAQFGVYSHRYGDLWLAGGASNTGGGVLKNYFSNGQLESLSRVIDPETGSGLDYYPLFKPGERFPYNDPQLAPRLSPRPDTDIRFLHGMLEGLARIEAAGYARLAELGATPLRAVVTSGGGAHNPAWQRIRERMLGVPVTVARHSEAAYGAALLALRGGLG